MADAVFRFVVLGCIALVSTAAMAPRGAAPKSGSLKALGSLEQGQWELRERDSRGHDKPVRKLCVGDTNQLVQVRHHGAHCQRFVVRDGASQAVVTYQCNGKGNGRTDIRVETPRLVQIDAQGVEDSAPFAVSLEARKIGACP